MKSKRNINKYVPRKRAILFVIVIAFLWGLIAEIGVKEEKKEPIKEQEEKNSKKAEFVYDSKGMPDPFIPLVTEKGGYISGIGFGAEGAVNLEGILWDPEGKSSWAIINGKILKEGQKVADIEVLRIGQDRVYITVGGKETCIKVGPKPQRR